MTTIATPDRDFIRVGRSRIEGTGVFAKRRIPRGARIIEYTGDRIPVGQPVDPEADGKIYRLAIDEATAIDGARNGNAARFANHSCQPNCEIYVFDGHAYLYAARDVVRGEELTFDYRLAPADPTSPVDDSTHPCRCAAPGCRGTMLAPRPTAA